MSNLKQISLGMMMYTQDYDEHYPLSSWCKGSTCSPEDVAEAGKPSGLFNVYAGGSTSHHHTWMDFIYPYVKSTQLFVCPSSQFSRDTPNYGYSTALSNYSSVSYYLGNTLPYNIPISMAAVPRPSEVIVSAEMSTTDSLTMSAKPVRSYAAPTSGVNGFKVVPHLGGGNVVYADGHVKWRSRATIFANIGPTFNTSAPCKLNVIDDDNGYCSSAWNPYRD